VFTSVSLHIIVSVLQPWSEFSSYQTLVVLCNAVSKSRPHYIGATFGPPVSLESLDGALEKY